MTDFIVVQPSDSEMNLVKQALKESVMEAEINRRANILAKQIAQELFNDYLSKYRKDIEDSVRMALEYGTDRVYRGGW